MPEYKYSTGWDSYDYGGCKCNKISHIIYEIREINLAIADVDKLKVAYSDIHDMYSDIIKETEAVLYIKDNQVIEIENKVVSNEDNHISNLNDCINSFNSSLRSKEQKEVDLRRIDDRYHRED